MGKLTAKQEAFCLEYLKDLNATQAAIRAGYKEKTARQSGSENLSKPDIADKIAELMEERSNKAKIDAEWVLTNAKKVFDRCMQFEQVMNRDGSPVYVSTEDGDLVPAFKFEPSGANKALEIIGKHVDVNAFTKQPEEDQDAASLNITFGVNEPVGEIKVTRGE